MNYVIFALGLPPTPNPSPRGGGEQESAPEGMGQ
jgi:hypothetical protein